MSDTVASQEAEYGYRTPNGQEYFLADSINPQRGPAIPFFDKLNTAEGQAQAQERYRNILRAQGIPEEGNELVFIQRVRTVLLSDVIPLPPSGSVPLPYPYGRNTRLAPKRRPTPVLDDDDDDEMLLDD